MMDGKLRGDIDREFLLYQIELADWMMEQSIDAID